MILRDIASGLRFAWKDSGNRRGLARELGFTGNENERRSRFSILSSDGITPEQYAERLYFQYGGGNTEQAHWDMDDKTIKDAVLEVLSRIHSPRQAYNAAVRLHNDTPNPYDDMDEEDYARMQEYEAEQERVRTELLYDDAFAQWAGQTSQDQWAEIDNLFIEDASESSKTLTLKRQRQHLPIQQIMTTKPKTETGLTPQRLERLATIVARLSMENNVTPQQVMMRISDNRAAGRPQFDMEADWTQYPAPSPTTNDE